MSTPKLTEREKAIRYLIRLNFRAGNTTGNSKKVQRELARMAVDSMPTKKTKG